MLGFPLKTDALIGVNSSYKYINAVNFTLLEKGTDISLLTVFLIGVSATIPKGELLTIDIFTFSPPNQFATIGFLTL